MKPRDMNIATQLRLGLGVILTFVVALGVMTWIQADRLSKQTQMMYKHPLQVRQALGNVETDIERMSLHLRDRFLARNEAEGTEPLQGIELEKADIERQIAVLRDRYLGPREDVSAVQEELTKWNALRDETIRLFRAGKISEAEDRVRTGGVQSDQAAVARDCLKKLKDFAAAKADQLHNDALATNDTVNRQSVAMCVAIIFLTLAIAWVMMKGIQDPIRKLTAAAEEFGQGKTDVRSGYVSANEFGMLSAAFNAMADTIQTEMQVNKNAAQLAGVMLREEEVHAFCREMLKELLHHTDSQVGAVYILNEAGTAFEHVASIGLDAGSRAAFSATDLEGELGAAVATRRIQRITRIPADTRFTFAAVSGAFKPREIVTIPVLSDHTVSAVISLASVRAFDPAAIRLISDIWSVLTARVNGVLAFRKVKDLVAALEHQNQELDAQKRELAAQAQEVTEQNAELEMQKKQLSEANRLKNAFLSNMSHELRTPLNSVIALAGVLNRRLAKTIPEEEYGYLEIIERNGKSLLTLINDILDLSRIEAGHEDVSVRRFSIRELVDEIVTVVMPQAQEKHIALHNEVPEGLPSISSDQDKCLHILQNLVSNAVKFTEAGTVSISAVIPQSGIDNPQPHIVISVTDTGIGIAAEQLPFIFDEFRQADDSTSRKYGGTGLGLAIATKYARLLGGRITVESTPGQGSTFKLSLPLTLAAPSSGREEEPDSRSARGATPPPVTHSGGRNILLVEDSESAVIQLTDILGNEGYRIHVARNGAEALAQVQQALPDALILDLMMPEVDGFQVLKEIRGQERTAHLPVLILTAKHVTKEELSFLKGNHIHQLIQKGDVNKAGLLAEVARMVAPPPIPIPTSAFRASRSQLRSGKPVVLIVEDNPDSLRTAHALLSERYQVIEAADGRAGVEQARVHRPDIILMDIAMPVMDGIAALLEIRADDALRATPVIAVTASAMKGDRETILAHGFDGYLSKPIDHDALMKTLQQMLD